MSKKFVDNSPDRFAKPTVVVSRCLGFENCRYNGQIISSDEVKDMRDHLDFITVCPESEIGLGIPRDPVRLVFNGEKRRLVQPNTGKDFTREMKDFAEDFLTKHSDVDGFILKSKSPSCGLKETKIYSGIDNSAPVGKGPGLFGKDILKRLPRKAIETEGRLRNYQIREHFLTKIYAFADFRERKGSQDFKELKEYHDHNRLLFKSYDEELYKRMDKVLEQNEDVSELYDRYEDLLYELFNQAPQCESKIQIMNELFQDFKDMIDKDEIAFFKESLEDYSKGNTSLNVPLSILYTWLLRFKDANLKDQSFFFPYTKDLVRLEDVRTCISRDYWNF
ncbi:MAG: YbgA family protein [Thermoplasmatota archaeon]